MNVKDKVAIVTGASSGIGLATAKFLSSNGAKVALVARSKEKLEKLSKELHESLVVVADMTAQNEIRDMVAKVESHYGRIDILVNNAGGGYDASIEKTNIETFTDIFNLDVLGPFIAMQEVIPVMRKQKTGVIINISSGTALMALPNMGVYSSMKRALSQISLTAREELKDDNIIVSVVYPYITITDFEKNTIKEIEEGAGEEGGGPYPPDTAEFVAERIVDGIKTGEAEIYVHDWMKNLH